MIDFQELKAKLRIEEVAKSYVELIQEGDVLRAPCPVCAPRNGRAILITPEKQLYYCFTAKRGGDLISLVAHVREVSQRSAAEMLVTQYVNAPAKEEGAGFPKGICKSTGIGFAKASDLVDRVPTSWKKPVKIPIRNELGELLNYILVTEAQLPKEWP